MITSVPTNARQHSVHYKHTLNLYNLWLSYLSCLKLILTGCQCLYCSICLFVYDIIIVVVWINLHTYLHKIGTINKT